MNANVNVNAAKITDIFEVLSEESCSAVISYAQYLMEKEGKRKAEHTKRIFEEMSEILDGDTGWASEEEMIADLAEFRRKRTAGNENTD